MYERFEKKLKEKGFGGDFEIMIVMSFIDCEILSVLFDKMIFIRVKNYSSK